jgi:ankyrin repeat protein
MKKRKADDFMSKFFPRQKASCHVSIADACDVARLMLTKGADGDTPLGISLQEGYVDVIRFLLTLNADVNGVERWTPLHLACIGRRIDKARLLILDGADYEIRDNDGKTAFEYLKRCSLDTCRYEEHAARAEVEQAVRDYISTNLYEACRRGDLEFAQRLIAKGADENEIKLAFHIACTTGHLDIAHILVTVGGADVNLFNYVSIWPLQKIYLTYLFYIVFFAVISTRLYSMEIRLFWLRVS